MGDFDNFCLRWNHVGRYDMECVEPSLLEWVEFFLRCCLYHSGILRVILRHWALDTIALSLIWSQNNTPFKKTGANVELCPVFTRRLSFKKSLSYFETGAPSNCANSKLEIELWSQGQSVIEWPPEHRYVRGYKSISFAPYKSIHSNL